MSSIVPNIDAGERAPALAPKREQVSEPTWRTLEVFDAPGGHVSVAYHSDEVTALCPITGQPDYYTVVIELTEAPRLLESKSLKLYLGSYRQHGGFAEALASQIADDVAAAIDHVEVTVRVVQKPRGGIAIDARSQAQVARGGE